MSVLARIARKRSVSTNLTVSSVVGVTMQSTGSALVSVALDRSGDFHHPRRTCTGIERLPFDVGKVADRIETLELGPRDLVVIDGGGAGMALWLALGSPRRHFKLYEGVGRERQRLVDPFPQLMRDGSFSFAPGLAHQDSMLRALAGYRREVLDDGVVGNELAIALFLAIGHRPSPPLRMA
jgi:hypothetical protein